jgi:hypothetical protein
MEGDHLGVLDVDGRIILKFILKKKDTKVRTGFASLRIGISGELL